MHDSNWITLFGVIMVSFETNSHAAEPIKIILRSQLVIKKIYLFKIFHYIPCEVLLSKKLKCKKHICTINIQLSAYSKTMQQKKGDKHFLSLTQIHNYLISPPTKPQR